MNKCNFFLLKNKKDENILYQLIKIYKIDTKIIQKYIDKFDIFEQNINGDNLYNLISHIYGKEIKYILTKNYIIDSQIKFNNPYHINIKVINNEFNIKDLLVKTHNGSFNSNTIHYIIYLLTCLNKYDFYIPNDSNSSHKYLLQQSNNNEKFLKLIHQYYDVFNNIFPHLIIWENINNYFIHPKLIDLIINSKQNFVYIKLTFIISLPNDNYVRHANIILIDKLNKIIERFEPYGNLCNTFNKQLNSVLEKNISDKLKYKFIYCNPYAGFQTLSDEYNQFNRTTNDPPGYCLAWCMLYLEIKLKYKYDCFKTISLIKNYIINIFKNDYNIKNDSNVYMMFIRYYVKYLDDAKNKIANNCNIDTDIIYHSNMKNKDLNIIVKCLNDKISEYI